MHGIFVNGVTEVVVLSFPTPNCFSIRFTFLQIRTVLMKYLFETIREKGHLS